jgi:hypothetical protein
MESSLGERREITEVARKGVVGRSLGKAGFGGESGVVRRPWLGRKEALYESGVHDKSRKSRVSEGLGGWDHCDTLFWATSVGPVGG